MRNPTPVARSETEEFLIARAKARLDRLDFYPRPVRTERVRIFSTPWLFRVPGFRRFRGYEAGPWIFVTMPVAEAPEDLIVHELCHVWQDQHRRLRMWLSYLWQGYRHNEHEIEAREAVRKTL